MTELLTAAKMRAIEHAAIASGEVTGLELMERAGRGVVEAIFEEWPELRATSHRVVVLCGPGHNGGDGFVVARLLQEWGWEVEVFLYGDPERMPPDAQVNYERWVGMGEVRSDFGALAGMPTDILVDALFGTGLTRPIEAELYGAIDGPLDRIQFNGSERIVAVDVPSGMCADSGRGLDMVKRRALPVVSASIAVTFHLSKIGHYLADGPGYSGKVYCKSIGLTHLRATEKLHAGEVVEWPPVDSVILIEPSDRVEFELDRVSKEIGDHKYSHGHALILSGPSGRGGAARLAARGALRIGAGVVTVGCPLDAIPENAARLDAVMLRGVADGDALAGVLEDQRINALCVGPGLGLDARGSELVAVALGVLPGSPPPPSPPHAWEGSRNGQASRANGDSEALPLPPVGRGEGRGARPVVLDADALTILSQNPDLFAALHGACVLTPHAGEFARLFPDIAEKLAAPATKGPAYSKVDATREAAKRAGCVVLYKGPDTVIADPSGRCAINSAHYDRAAPWLATAGSGDVLAGFITGLLARGVSPFDAACTGAWLHVECALSFGPGLIAEDLPEELPKVFRALGL
ncbi:MAG: NAD(P)H-hydrate epimerase [Tabrizicola sp.]|nr:NAD(P)H-hydrate epimerase [Tabrizicola sp.]